MVKILFINIIFLWMTVTGCKAQILQHYTIFPMNRIFTHPAYAGIECPKSIQIYGQHISFNRDDSYAAGDDQNTYRNHEQVLSFTGVYESRMDEKGKHNFSIVVDALLHRRSNYPTRFSTKKDTNYQVFSLDPSYTYRRIYNEYKSLSFAVTPSILFFNYDSNIDKNLIYGIGVGTWYQTKSFRGGLNTRLLVNSYGDLFPRIDLQASYIIKIRRREITPFINISALTNFIFDGGLTVNIWKKYLLLGYTQNFSLLFRLDRFRRSDITYNRLYIGAISLVINTKSNLTLGCSYGIPIKIEQPWYSIQRQIILASFSNQLLFELSARYRFPLKDKEKK